MKFFLPAFIWLGCILFINYVPSQEDFHFILPGLFGAFASYFFLVRNSKSLNWQAVIVLALLGRFLIVPAIPNLSDDIYRFIWDGRLWLEGIHPFSILPSEAVGITDTLNHELYEHLNSKEYYSIYPPIAQLTFILASAIGQNDIYVTSIFLKLIHATVDTGAIFLMISLLRSFNLPKERVVLYAMNPLIVIELTGNLHHEVFIVFFVLLTIYFFRRSNMIRSGLSLALAIAAKILPVMFLPVLVASLNWKKGILFLLTVIIGSSLLFWPVIPEWQIIRNFAESADLYMRKFEFNASIYYMMRGIGYWIKGYNLIGTLGPFLSVMSIILIIGIAVSQFIQKRQNAETIILLLLWTYCIYTFLSPTLHPWYISILIALCIFSRFRFPIIWSALIMLTYINYSYSPYREQLWLVTMEYIIVFSFLLYEIRRYGILDSKKLYEIVQQPK